MQLALNSQKITEYVPRTLLRMGRDTTPNVFLKITNFRWDSAVHCSGVLNSLQSVSFANNHLTISGNRPLAAISVGVFADTFDARTSFRCRTHVHVKIKIEFCQALISRMGVSPWVSSLCFLITRVACVSFFYCTFSSHRFTFVDTQESSGRGSSAEPFHSTII